VFHGVPDVAAGPDGLNYTVPRDAFIHTDARAIIKLEARLVDGQPLPAWVAFDGITGLFNGQPAPSARSALLDVELIARDNTGREARTTFRIGEAGQLGARLESSDRGFQVARMSQAQLAVVRPQASGDLLIPYMPIRDVRHTVAQGLAFQIPADAFAHTNPRAVVRLTATLAGGEPLPGWITFDGVTGQLAGSPPADFAGTLEIRVVARDDHGLEAVARFKLTVARASERPAVEARAAAEPAPAKRAAPSFAEQLRQLRQQPGERDQALLREALGARSGMEKADEVRGGTRQHHV
jgi:hypothetical protein